MPTITNNTAAAGYLPMVRRFVQVKSRWDDDDEDWQYVPYLEPISCVDAAAPEIGSADFVYVFGRIKREDQTSFASYSPINLKDYYIRILTQRPGEAAQAYWTGIVTEDVTVTDRATSASGEQQIRAYSLAHLLDRVQINEAYVRDNNETKEIMWCPEFNRRHRRGRTLIGNRSTATFTADGTEATTPALRRSAFHLFSRDNEMWTNGQIVRYLIGNFAPPAFTWKLTGQVSVLDTIDEVHNLEGLSVWEALNRLISRRRGLGFNLVVGEGKPRMDGSTDAAVVYLNVWTATEQTIRYGSKSLPANPNRVTFGLPTSLPHSHLVDDIPFRATTSTLYDIIEVRGERIRIAATFSYADGSLEKGWTTALENEYATGSLDPDVNDKARSVDRFDGVFCRHQVPTDWDWRCGDGIGTNLTNVAVTVNEDATYTFGAVGPYWNNKRTFERDTPFEVGKRYDQPQVDDEAESENAVDQEPEFRSLFAIVKDLDNGSLHEADQKDHFADKLRDYSEYLDSATVRPLDKELGVEVSVRPNHLFALNHWDPNTVGASNTDPEIDYERLVVTASFKSDMCVSLIMRSRTDEESDAQRRLVIEVKGAELWLASTSTVVDIGSDGYLAYIHPSNVVLRDDRDKLRAHAAFAAAWYGVRRQVVQIPIKQIGLYCPLGAMLMDITAAWGREPVRTVVTSRSTSFRDGTTSIETGWGSLDRGPEPVLQ